MLRSFRLAVDDAIQDKMADIGARSCWLWASATALLRSVGWRSCRSAGRAQRWR